MAPEADSRDATAATQPADEPSSSQFRQRAVRGSVWVVLGYGSAQVIRLASNLVLARLLFPEAFGLMLLVNVYLQGLYMFSDLGIGASIIQNQRSDADFLNTAWTVQVIRGFVLWAAACAGAWPFAHFFEHPVLLYMLPVAGLVAVIDGFTSTSFHTVNRRLLMGRLELFELTVQSITAVVTIVCAWLMQSVWALIIGALVGKLAWTVLSHLVLPGVRSRFRWEREAAASLVSFGGWVFVSSILTFLAQQGDRLIFGKMIPTARLGVYNIALNLCEGPSALINTISFKIFFPLFSELRRTAANVTDAYGKAGTAVSLLAGLGAIPLALLGPWLVTVLYDPRYVEAGWMLRMLALGIWMNTLVSFAAAAVLAHGRTKWLAAANGGRLVWIVGTVPLVFHVWGFKMAVLSVALSDLPRYTLLGLGVRRDGLRVFGRDLVRTLGFGSSLGLGFAVMRVFHEPTGPLAAACGATAGVAVWCVLNRTAVRQYWEKARGYLRAVAERRAAGARAG